MKLKYQISESDFMDAYGAFWRSRKQNGKVELTSGVVAVAFGVLLVFLGNAAGWVLIGTGAILATLVAIRYYSHRRAYRETPAMGSEVVVEFGDEQIEVINPVGKSQLEWSFYLNALESDDFFLLMISKRSFSIIPKRSFQSDEEIDLFRNLLELKLGSITQI